MGLNVSTIAADGSERSAGAKLIDPVGACIQPADLAPFEEVIKELDLPGVSAAATGPQPVDMDEA